MIHLPLKNQEEVPDKLSSVTALRRLNTIVDDADGSQTMSYYYGDDVVRDQLRAFSIHKNELEEGDRAKCYYCESYAEVVATLQVEHYRPKASVDSQDTGGVVHPGYYWLILEWTNLVLSCPKCNGRDAKGSRFPVRGLRAQPVNPIVSDNEMMSLNRQHCYASGNPLIDESPLLINPEIDNPSDFLTFNLNGHLIGHGNDPERGNTTIEICKLNRGALIESRISFWNEIKKDILDDCAIFQMGLIGEDGIYQLFKKTSRKIFEKQRPKQEYSFFGQFINKEIERFIEIDVPPDFHFIFKNAYRDFIEEIAPND